MITGYNIYKYIGAVWISSAISEHCGAPSLVRKNSNSNMVLTPKFPGNINQRFIQINLGRKVFENNQR